MNKLYNNNKFSSHPFQTNTAILIN